jgi:hypothetical protein
MRYFVPVFRRAQTEGVYDVSGGCARSIAARMSPTSEPPPMASKARVAPVSRIASVSRSAKSGAEESTT